MSYDRMLLILTFVVAIIGLVLGSVAVSREDSHEFIDLTNSSSSILPSTSILKSNGGGQDEMAERLVQRIRFISSDQKTFDDLTNCSTDICKRKVLALKGITLKRGDIGVINYEGKGVWTWFPQC